MVDSKNSSLVTVVEEKLEVTSTDANDQANNGLNNSLPEVGKSSPTNGRINVNYGHQFWKDILRSSRYILAPMVDQSELAFRLMVRGYGAECTYSPMFNASIFVKDPKYRRDCLQVLPELDRPLIIQFCANKPETFVEAAQMAAPFCEAIDLNLGCPQTIAKRGHYGAFLQDEWELIHNMVNLATKEVDKPITCKIRIFEEVDKTVQYAKMIESAGASLLGVHGRYREQKGPVTGLASWEHIKAVKDAVKVPVFANGNIQCLDDVTRCLKQTGVEGVMSAEGILHNPSIFTGRAITVWEATREYLQLAQQHPPPFSYVRGHVFKFLHHCLALEEHQALRRVVAKTHQIESLQEVANSLEQHYRPQYEQYLVEHPEHLNTEPSSIHPDSLPIYFCKPYYRPPPTQFNSKVVPKSEPDQSTEAEQQQTDQRELHPQQQPQPISKRQLKKMEKCAQNKKLKIGDIVEDCIPMRAPVKRLLELCVQCPNPKGAKCEFDFCKKCCRIKTHEEVLDCKGHRFDVKTRQLKATLVVESA